MVCTQKDLKKKKENKKVTFVSHYFCLDDKITLYLISDGIQELIIVYGYRFVEKKFPLTTNINNDDGEIVATTKLYDADVAKDISVVLRAMLTYLQDLHTKV